MRAFKQNRLYFSEDVECDFTEEILDNNELLWTINIVGYSVNDLTVTQKDRQLNIDFASNDVRRNSYNLYHIIPLDYKIEEVFTKNWLLCIKLIPVKEEEVVITYPITVK